MCRLEQTMFMYKIKSQVQSESTVVKFLNQYSMTVLALFILISFFVDVKRYYTIFQISTNYIRFENNHYTSHPFFQCKLVYSNKIRGLHKFCLFLPQ